MSNKGNNQNIRAAIIGVEGITLSEEEKKLFKKYKPIGYILFGRNYQNPTQLQQLIVDLKNAAGHEHVLILIDQEGERVSRLKAPDFTVLKNAASYGNIALSDPSKASNALQQDFRKVGKELKKIGINVNCAPVADLYFENTNAVIGPRSYGQDPEIVATLCQAVDIGLQNSGVQSVIKHIPGHGRSIKDSHEELPIITTDLPTLEATDFKVFKNLKDLKMAMAAHIIYTALDHEYPVTLSKKAVGYIRNNIGFQGLLITDALEMKALHGPIRNLVTQSLTAGFDIVLHCTGKLNDNQEVLSSCKNITENAMSKVLKLNAFAKV